MQSGLPGIRRTTIDACRPFPISSMVGSRKGMFKYLGNVSPCRTVCALFSESRIRKLVVVQDVSATPTLHPNGNST